MKTSANLFALVGLVTLSYLSVMSISTRLYQTQETQRFFTEGKSEPHSADTTVGSKSPTAEGRPYPDAGSAVAMLAIPRLGLSAIVVEGAEDRQLRLGPGHIPGTSLPGEGGNVGLAGHRDTFFRPLRLIRKDDRIEITTHERDYQYKVISTKIVGPDQVQELYPKGRETLTLVTCYPFDFVGSAPKRFIVQADCVDCPRQKPIQIEDGR